MKGTRPLTTDEIIAVSTKQAGLSPQITNRQVKQT